MLSRFARLGCPKSIALQNVNFSNNIVLNGQHTQLLYSCFSGPKRPGNRFLRNIISFSQTGDDGLTPVGDWPAVSMASWAERVLDISCLNASRTPYDPTRLAEVGYNLYYDPELASPTGLGRQMDRSQAGGPSAGWTAIAWWPTRFLWTRSRETSLCSRLRQPGPSAGSRCLLLRELGVHSGEMQACAVQLCIYADPLMGSGSGSGSGSGKPAYDLSPRASLTFVFSHPAAA